MQLTYSPSWFLVVLYSVTVLCASQYRNILHNMVCTWPHRSNFQAMMIPGSGSVDQDHVVYSRIRLERAASKPLSHACTNRLRSSVLRDPELDTSAPGRSRQNDRGLLLDPRSRGATGRETHHAVRLTRAGCQMVIRVRQAFWIKLNAVTTAVRRVCHDRMHYSGVQPRSRHFHLLRSAHRGQMRATCPTAK